MCIQTGLTTRACIGTNSWAAPNVSQCKTIELMNLQDQARNLLSTVKTIKTTKSLHQHFNVLDTLISITVVLKTTINTTIPLLPNDIPVIVNILETILKYVRIHV